MAYLTLALILFSVFLSVLAQILLKHGMSNGVVQGAISQGPVDTIWAVATNLSVFLGLTAYVSSAAVWLFVLSKVDVSKAYPFVGLGFIGTMLFGYWFLNEPLTTTKVVGTGLICAGVFIVSR